LSRPLEQVFDRVLTTGYLGQLLDEVRKSYGIRQLEKELVEARVTLEELERGSAAWWMQSSRGPQAP